MYEAAFLQDICEHADDDAPRLVYADWLEEQGGEDRRARAEFIRAQCALARLPRDDPRRWDLLERERTLLDRHETAWAAPLRDVASRWRFRRGFVEDVTLPCETLLRRGDELYRLAPVRYLRLRGTGQLPALLQAPHRQHKFASLLAPLRGLDLSHDYPRDDVGLVLLNLPHLPRLGSLNLARNQLTAPALRTLAEAPVLGSLTSLECGGGSAGLGGVQALLASPHLGRLHELKLSGSRLLDAGVGLLVSLPVLARLRALHVGHGAFTPAGLGTLVHAPAVANLTTLDLSFNHLETAGVRLLAESPHLERLEELNLSRTGLGDAGVGELAAVPLPGRLQALDLSLNRITDAGAAALAGYAHPSRLAVLDLIYNRFGPDAMRDLRQRFGDRVCLFHR
jgi:uncharacterized protein (TIGR02996 family)